LLPAAVVAQEIKVHHGQLIMVVLVVSLPVQVRVVAVRRQQELVHQLVVSVVWTAVLADMVE
jgi:hypothetical protein